MSIGPQKIKPMSVRLNNDWAGRLVLGFIGLYTLGCSVFYRPFAELHLQFPFLPFPVFIGEFLLLFSVLVYLAREKHLALPNYFRTGLRFYVLWIILKAVWGAWFWGPLTFRNAALFYYLLFFVVGYSFYKNEIFSHRVKMGLLTVLLAAKIIVGVNNYFIFPYFILTIILALQIKTPWLRYLMFLPILYTPPQNLDYPTLTPFAFFFMGGRARVVGHLAAFLFISLVTMFTFFQIKARYKFFLLSFLVLVLGLGLIKYLDRNALKAMVDIPGIITLYKEHDAIIEKKRPLFVRPLSVNLYSEELVQFSGAVSRRVKEILPKIGGEESKDINILKDSVKDILETSKASYVEAVAQAKEERKEKIQAVLTQLPVDKSDPQLNELVKEATETDDLKNVQENLQLNELVKEATETDDSENAQENPQFNELVKEATETGDLKSVQENLRSYIAKKSVDQGEEIIKQLQSIEEDYEHTANLLRLKEKAEVFNKVQEKIDTLGLQREFSMEEGLALATDPDQLRDIGTSYSNILFRLFIWRDMMRELMADKAVLWGVNWGKPQRSPSIEVFGWAAVEWEKDGWITPHNSFLYFLYRGGIVGGMILLGVLTVIVSLTRKFIEKKSLAGLLLVSIFIYWMTITNFLVFLELPYNAIPFWSLLGMLLAYGQTISRQAVDGRGHS